MRCIILGMATKESEAGPPPKPEAFVAMQEYNEAAVKAGVLLAAEGLTPTSKGVRVKFNGDQRTVIDGPFTETKELVAGFWIVQGKSKEEIVERFTHAPFDGGQVIEIRQVFEAEDFGDDLPPEIRNQEALLREHAG